MFRRQVPPITMSPARRIETFAVSSCRLSAAKRFNVLKGTSNYGDSTINFWLTIKRCRTQNERPSEMPKIIALKTGTREFAPGLAGEGTTARVPAEVRLNED